MAAVSSPLQTELHIETRVCQLPQLYICSYYGFFPFRSQFIISVTVKRKVEELWGQSATERDCEILPSNNDDDGIIIMNYYEMITILIMIITASTTTEHTLYGLKN